jgi:hypothetical protein
LTLKPARCLRTRLSGRRILPLYGRQINECLRTVPTNGRVRLCCTRPSCTLRRAPPPRGGRPPSWLKTIGSLRGSCTNVRCRATNLPSLAISAKRLSYGFAYASKSFCSSLYRPPTSHSFTVRNCLLPEIQSERRILAAYRREGSYSWQTLMASLTPSVG